MSILGNPVCLPIGGKAAKGSHLFLGISLPRSIYYEQAADWLKIKDIPKTTVTESQWDGQVVCGGNLWELYGNNAYCYSLENGELLETVPLTGIGSYCGCGITTDGTNRIWIIRLSYSARDGSSKPELYGGLSLYEFNIETKSVKLLHQTSTSQMGGTSGSHYAVTGAKVHNVLKSRTGIIGYSKESNKIYFGKIAAKVRISYSYKMSLNSDWREGISEVHGTSAVMLAYDLITNTCAQIAPYPHDNAYAGQYFYDDGDFFYVGNGFNETDKEKRISRYNKLSNIWENLSTNFEGYTVGPFSYVQIGDKMLQISKDATGVFDPKTGNLEQSTVPTVPPDSMVMYPGFKAYANNILYLVTNQGIYKCPFFSEIPEDAPIVAKIYKGQKYHTLEPFEIPNKIKFLRTQQIADKDYEIKMYEYASEGGQTIFIEDAGE